MVIGGGPAGYPAAILLARSGLRVALVEEHLLGGECTNYGCIPTKALYSRALHARLSGVDGPDLPSLARWAWEDPVARSREGVRALLESAGAWVVEGRAVLAGERLVEVNGGPALYAERAVLLAPGSRPAHPPGLEPDGFLVVDNRGFIDALRRRPSRALVVGGGPVGVEYATLMALSGVEVVLVEVMKRILPGMDRSLGQAVEASLRRLGARVWKGSTVKELRRRESVAVAQVAGRGEVEVDLVVVATGRRPATGGLGLEKVRALLDERGFIEVERPSMRALHPWLYAAGDAAGPPLLAHKAFHESLSAARSILGVAPLPSRPVPMVVYTHPQVVSVGLTLEEARSRGLEAAEVRVPAGALARVYIEGGERGFVKIVYERPTQRILGLHAFLPEAGELAAYAASLIVGGTTLRDLAAIVHPHPTVSEALWEAAMAALDSPVHVSGVSTR